MKIVNAARRHSLYSTWNGIKYRCYYKKHKAYKYYGARGIKLCDEWKKDFWAFVAAVGPRPDGMTLDRIDNDKGYEPGNVRWATASEQLANSRNPIQERPITFRGVSMSMGAWADKQGISIACLSKRLHLGWSTEDALTVPVLRRRTIIEYERQKEGRK